jgi:hypothetical protein
MGAHLITSPDGQKYQINAPDDATPEQLNAVAAQFIQSLPKQPQTPSLPPSAPGATETALGMVKDVGVGGAVGASDIGRTVMNVPGMINRATGGGLENIPGVTPALNTLKQASQRAGEVGREFYDAAGPMAFAGRAGAHTLGTLGATGPITAGTRAFTTLFPATKAAAPYLNTAAMGATEGAYTNPDAPGTSALIGAGVGPVAHRVLKMATGAGRSPDSDILTSAGVNLPAEFASPKRTVPGRLISRAAEGFSTFPVIGDMIKRRQQAALDEARRAAVKQGQVPGGRELPKDASIDQMLAQQAEDQAKYVQQATAGEVFRPDVVAKQRTMQILNDPNRMLRPEERDKVINEVDRLITEQTRRGQYRQPTVGPPTPANLVPKNMPREWDPQTLLRGQESLRRLAESKKYLGSSDAVKQDMGLAMREIADEVYELISRQSPRAGQALKEIRPQQNVHRILSEVAKDQPRQGEFTFPALARHKDIGSTPNLETFARVGAEHLPSVIPEQTAAPRIFWALASLLNPKLAATAGVGASLFASNPGNKILLGETAAQRKLADLLQHLEVK